MTTSAPSGTTWNWAWVLDRLMSSEGSVTSRFTGSPGRGSGRRPTRVRPRDLELLAGVEGDLPPGRRRRDGRRPGLGALTRGTPVAAPSVAGRAASAPAPAGRDVCRGVPDQRPAQPLPRRHGGRRRRLRGRSRRWALAAGRDPARRRRRGGHQPHRGEVHDLARRLLLRLLDAGTGPDVDDHRPGAQVVPAAPPAGRVDHARSRRGRRRRSRGWAASPRPRIKVRSSRPEDADRPGVLGATGPAARPGPCPGVSP